jgi:very-short-patch-repair endonuclease
MRGLRIHETDRSRTLHRGETPAERALWRRLRGRAIGGAKFVRQAPIGPYFADFGCREQKLVVEVDGATHSTALELSRDALRESFLSAHGYRVVRFANDDIYRNLNGVVDTILAAIERRSTLVE